MSTTSELYKQQKLGDDRTKRYTTIIKITETSDKEVNGKKIIQVMDEEGQWFTHWIDSKNEGWEDYLKPGNRMAVYVVSKPRPLNPDRPYLTIYPNHFSPEPLNGV